MLWQSHYRCWKSHQIPTQSHAIPIKSAIKSLWNPHEITIFSRDLPSSSRKPQERSVQSGSEGAQIGTPFLVDLAFKQCIKKPLCWWKPHFSIGQDMWNPIFWLMTFQFLSLKSEIAMEFHWKQRFIPTFPRSDAAFPGICWPQGHAWWEFLGKADGNIPGPIGWGYAKMAIQ